MRETNKNLTTNNIQQHAAETLWLCMHKIKYFLKIVYLGRTTNVNILNTEIIINTLAMPGFDTKE